MRSSTGAVHKTAPALSVARYLEPFALLMAQIAYSLFAFLKKKTRINVNVHAGFRVVPRWGLELQTN